MTRFYLSQKNYFVAIALFTLLSGALLFISYETLEEQVHQEAASQLESHSAIRLRQLEKALTDSLRHTEFLHATPPVQGILRATQNNDFDALEQTALALWKQRLQVIFSAYLEHNTSIAQIRYIGTANNGRELVRVQREGDQALVITGDKLQEKESRDYFLAAHKLGVNDVYISEINLNQEFGKIEEPAWPTYRIAKAVFDEYFNFFGIIIINFDATPLLDTLTKDIETGQNLFLLNARSEYLIHPDKSNNFSFEYGETSNWNDDIEPGTKKSKTSNIHYITYKPNNQGLAYVRQKIDADNPYNFPQLTIILASNAKALETITQQRFTTIFFIISALLLVIIILLYFYRRFSQLSLIALEARIRFETLIASSNDAILSTSIAGEIQTLNHAALQLFEVDKHSNSFKSINDLFSANTDKEKILSKFSEAVQGLTLPYFNTTYVTTKGEVKYISLALSAMKINNNIIGVSAILRDISDSHHQNAIQKSLIQKLEDKNIEMEQFLYTVSHDLRSPLVTISGFSKAILESSQDSLNDKNIHRLNRIIINVTLMGNILEDLLNISRIIREDINLETCNIKNCISQIETLLEKEILQSKASITLQSKLENITANKRMLLQCLQNLIENCIKYKHPAKPLEILISTTQSDNLVKISVQDNGIGINHKYHEQIFKIFERLQTGDGTGVGLAIVKTVMDKHNGWIELQSDENTGSTFTLCIPQPDYPNIMPHEKQL